MKQVKNLFGFAAIALAIIISLAGCKNPLDDNGPTPVTITALQGVTAPVIGAAPVTAITATKQYTGTITWSPADNSFKASTVYTATITLKVKEGYTLKGVAVNFFTVAGAVSVSNAASSGIITAVFPSTAGTAIEPVTIDIAAIGGVTAPVTGAAPVTAIETAQYAGTVTWSPAVSGTFAASTVYTATITLTAKNGYTLTGVTADFFTVAGATAINAANSGVITAVFPVTGEVGENGSSGDNQGGGNYVPPEDRPVKDRWNKNKWIDDTSTATLVYSVNDNGVCKITVGGVPESDNWWKANAHYNYTAKAGACYEYTFEAWTESGDRPLWVQYYWDEEDVYFSEYFEITNTRTTYTVRGTFLPKGGERDLAFLCANQLGTFYVKILEIKEYNIGKLTITNFSGSPGLTQNSWVGGGGSVHDLSYGKEDKGYIHFEFGGIGIWYDEDGFPREFITAVQIKGNTITIPVWERCDDWSYVPFTGNITVEVDSLFLGYPDGDDYASYCNIVPITFTNGNATINFGAQMEEAVDKYDESQYKHWGDYWYIEKSTAITITRYEGAGGSVTIPAQINGKPVIRISNVAFDYCTSLTSVTIPNSVTVIGQGAFKFCTSLTVINVDAANTAYSSENGILYNKNKTTLVAYPVGKIGSSFTIPNSVTVIGSYAFWDCTSLTSVIIPNGVTSIGEGAFWVCTSLTSVTIPNSVTVIGACAFGHCTSLTSVTIPNSVTVIGSYAFWDCTSLTSVTIPNSVIRIGMDAFRDCTSLTSVTIPNSVTVIGDGAFFDCTSLTSVTFQGTIAANSLGVVDDGYIYSPFDGDLRDKYLAKGPGTYTRASGGTVWTKQP